MLSVFKFSAAAFLLALVGGVLLLGPGVFSYVRTSARSVRDSVQQNVPVEFELKRARDLIESILPELQAQVRMIAEEEVEIAALQADIAESTNRLAAEELQLAKLRDQMRVESVSYQVGGRDWTRPQLTEQLAGRFERYKSGDVALASKQRLLEKRNESLAASLTTLDSMRQRKVELEHKVESLAAQSRLIQASQIDSGIAVDGSDLSEADQLLQQIETRLAVAERVLQHEQDFVAIPLQAAPYTETEVLADFDSYFDDSADQPQQQLVTVTTE